MAILIGMADLPGALATRLPAMLDRAADGVIEVRASRDCVYLHVHGGRLVFAESVSVEHSMGRAWIAAGHIDEEAHLEILQEALEEESENDDAAYARLAVVLGFLPSARMNDLLQVHVEGLVARAISWAPDRIAWAMQGDAGGTFPHLEIDLHRVIHRSIREFWDDTSIGAIVGASMTRYLQLEPGAVTVAEALGLPARQRALMSRMRGRRMVSQLIDDAGALAMDMARLIVTLHLVGLATFRDEPRAPSVVQERPKRPVSAPKLSAAKPKLVTERRRRAPSSDAVAAAPAPAPTTAAAAGPTPEELERQKRAVMEARARELRARYERTRRGRAAVPDTDARKRSAEIAVRNGRAALDAGDPAIAFTQFSRAVEADPERREYALYARWAGHLAPAQPEADLDALFAEARELLKAQPDFAFARYVLGAICEARGEHDKARRLLRRAVDDNPRLRDAARRLRVLELRNKG